MSRVAAIYHYLESTGIVSATVPVYYILEKTPTHFTIRRAGVKFTPISWHIYPWISDQCQFSEPSAAEKALRYAKNAARIYCGKPQWMLKPVKLHGNDLLETAIDAVYQAVPELGVLEGLL